MIIVLQSFILLMAAICVIAAYAIWKRHHTIRQSLGWPKITCEITHSNITRQDSKGRGAASYIYVPDIHYRYSVGGIEYTGNTVSFDLSAFNAMPKDATGKCKHYPQGSKSHVYYDRDDPSQSCLERPYKLASKGNKQIIVLAIVAIGLLALYAKLFL